MGFVDGEEGDFCTAEAVEKRLAGKALGGDVEELEVTVTEVGIDLLGLVCGECGIEPGGGDAANAEGIDLVFHKGDERGDNEGGAFEENGGELVAEGLARASGEKREGAFAGEKGADDGFLSGTK